jgi:hypothetical protein
MLYVNASYDDCQLSKAEVMQALEKALCAGVWLLGPSNAEKEVSYYVFWNIEVSELIKSLE